MAAPTLITPYGYSSGTCGYCMPSGTRSSAKSSSKYGMITSQMTPKFYQDLVDRGWRRSGDYVYHPDMARTCCPQYTIRLDVLNFKPSKKHRQVVNRFNRFLETGAKPGEDHNTSSSHIGHGNPRSSGASSCAIALKGAVKQGGGKGKGRAQAGDSVEALHAYEEGFKDAQVGAHKFQTELVPAKATKETFELYKAYQIAIHKDPPEKVTMRGYERFLCSKTLVESPIIYEAGVKTDHLPAKYGAYHLLYRIDGKLIGISVIDILPSCVSSVYFIWDPAFAWASLGKLSALYELGLARRMAQAGAKGMGWLYMGYWVPDCQKMRYKSEYAPSYLLDPGSNEFHLLNSNLESYLTSHPRGYRPFTEIEASSVGFIQEISPPNSTGKQPAHKDAESVDMQDEESDEDEDLPSSWPMPPPPSFYDPTAFTDDKIDSLLVLMSKGSFLSRRQVFQVGDLSFGDEESVKQEIREFLAAVGEEYVASVDNVSRGGMEGKALLYFG